MTFAENEKYLDKYFKRLKWDRNSKIQKSGSLRAFCFVEV